MQPGRFDIPAALARYDRRADQEAIRRAEEERQEILRRFPLESWPTLPVESYAAGQENSEDTFCRWIEFRSRNLGGIRGGSSRKLIVYKHRGKPGWYFPSVYQGVEEAWTAVRKGFVEAFTHAAAGDWDAIDDIAALQPGPALKVKTLHVYFPDQILPIYAKPHIQHFLGLLGRPEGEERTDDVVRLNRALRAALRGIPDLDGWNSHEVVRLLYREADPRESRRIVKIAPGEDARFWEECRAGGYICVGWDEIGDLREFESKEAFLQRFGEIWQYGGHKGAARQKAEELWTLMDLEPGDVIVANKGTSRILAVGKVVEPGYEWRPERPEYRHIVRVDWDTGYAKSIEPQKRWALVTVAGVPSTLYRRITEPTDGHPPPPPVMVDPKLTEIAAALQRKKQVIVYGPPGTGKTYTVRRFAVWWLLREERPEDAGAALSDPGRLRQLEQELATRRVSPGRTDGGPGIGRLTFLTFHPSYSYEDFVEGFRPVEGATTGLVVRLEDGIFKRICQEAQAHPAQKHLVVIDEINRANLAKVFGELLTLLEADKRGIQLVLPQSKQTFTIPDNVYLLGTMNTADRSIKLLDVALRRRFAFVELMPETQSLRGAKVRALELAEFLDTLNARIARHHGREKQLGHAFLLDGEQPLTDPDEFARRFRHEILPLLQEYCYEDYGTLATYLGGGLVEREAQTLKDDVLADTDRLLAALEDEFGRPEASEG